MRFTVLYNHNKFEYINNINTTINNKIDKQMTNNKIIIKLIVSYYSISL